MCWEIDCNFWAEQNKAQQTRVKQEQRAAVIDQLLTEANKPAEKTDAEATPVKQVVPAKIVGLAPRPPFGPLEVAVTVRTSLGQNGGLASHGS